MLDQLCEQVEQLTANPYCWAMLDTAYGQASGLTDSAARALRVRCEDPSNGLMVYGGSRAA